MASLVYARISIVNYEKGTADITLADREDQVIQAVPFLSSFYEMPGAGDLVAVLLEESGGQYDKGVILGTIYTKKNPPAESGKGIFYKRFSDGAYVKYNPSSRELEVKADKLIADEVLYQKLTQR